jgi:hypothetical protein
VRGPSGGPAATGMLFPELDGTSDPAPPARPRGSRALRAVARVLLWSLLAVGALRGLLPVPERPPPAATTRPADTRPAEAVAAAFVREYLTVGPDQPARLERLGRFTAAGVDLRGSVSLPDGVAQYADLVVAASSRPIDGGIEVVVLAHLLQLRSGAYQDGGTLAFAVPLAVLPGGAVVRGRPRPVAPPIASGRSLPRARAAPAELGRTARDVARQAVIALVASDRTTLARLGGGRPPSSRPLPSGWRAIRVGSAEVAEAAGSLTTREAGGSLTAHVPVRARPPAGSASYVVPVRVVLEPSADGLAVRMVDAGGSA